MPPPPPTVAVINHQPAPITVQLDGVATVLPAHGTRWGTCLQLPPELKSLVHTVSSGGIRMHHIGVSPAHATSLKQATRRNVPSTSPGNTALIVALSIVGAAVIALTVLLVLRTRRRPRGKKRVTFAPDAR